MTITDGELGLERADQERWLPDTCTRQRPALISDGRGGHTEGAPVTADYACRVAPTRGRELEVAARLTSQVSVTVTLPHDADVRAQDRLVIGGRTYQAVAVLAGGSWSTALRVLAVEVG